MLNMIHFHSWYQYVSKKIKGISCKLVTVEAKEDFQFSVYVFL